MGGLTAALFFIAGLCFLLCGAEFLVEHIMPLQEFTNRLLEKIMFTAVEDKTEDGMKP